MSFPCNVKCPACGKQGDWFAAVFGPFCSRRCKLVDLGKWFGEEHVVSEPLQPEHLEQTGDPPSTLPPAPSPDLS